jgi:hypothetical protein
MLFVLPILSIFAKQCGRDTVAMNSANIATVRYRFRRIFGRSFAIDHFKNEAIHGDEACVKNHCAQGIIDRLELRGKVSVTTAKRCRFS